jgi:hypothetical protein
MEARMRVEELAADMLRRYRDSQPPYILFLGRGCLREASSQYGEVLVRDLFKDYPWFESFKTLGWPNLLENTLSLAKTAAAQRAVLSLYRRLPVPSFYQDLAIMVRQGFFREILTTNFDTLLEQALEATGMRRGAEYVVFNLQKPQATPGTGAPGAVLLFKLHGDLNEKDFELNPETIEAALHMVKRELRQDLLVVGYESESQEINPWFVKNSGQVWWIAENTSASGNILSQLPNPHVLDGKYASPSWFFQHLSHLVVTSQFASWEGGGDDVPPLNLDRKAALKSEIEKARNALGNLLLVSTPSPELEAQMTYQRDWVAKMERELAALEGSTVETPVFVIDRILADFKYDPKDTLGATLGQQLNLLREEWSKPEPRMKIVSSVLGSTIMLGEQLGLSPQSIESLRSLPVNVK